jgi:adenylate cyclase
LCLCGLIPTTDYQEAKTVSFGKGKAALLLTELIEERLKPGSNVEEIDNKIWSMLGENWAVLCSDMSGFSRRTEEFGIIHFLSLIHEMHKLMKPVLLAHNGMLVKEEADNLFVIFREPKQAVQCALDMHSATIRYNENKTTDYQIAVCVGIGYGKILKLGDEDCFGSEVNLAFKLGEDIARPRETLLTPSAYDVLRGDNELRFETTSTDKTGLFTEIHKVLLAE